LSQGGDETINAARRHKPVVAPDFVVDLLASQCASGFAEKKGEQILNEVWGYDRLVTPRSIDRFVTALRQKIERDPQHPHFIQTVREFGYKFLL
jgi:DNA-binding response OmpR family regulator